MADDTTVTIGIKANVEGFKKSMQDAKRSIKDTGKTMSTQTAKMSKDMKETFNDKEGGLNAFSNAVKGVSPTLDGFMGSIGDIKNRFKEAGKAGKLAMLGVKIAVGGLAVGITSVLGKAIMETSGKFAAMTDPVRFDKNMSAMKESIRGLKTSIGELASPVFEYMSKGVKALADGLTWVVERIAMFVGLLQGLLGLGHKVNQTIAGTTEGMEEAGMAAEAGLASFDKLNTLNIGDMGDMEQAEKMANLMEKMRTKGAEFSKKIKDAVKPINDTLERIKAMFNMNPGELWDKFSASAVNAWESVKEWAGNTWASINETVAGAWSGMKEWAGNAWDGVKEKASQTWANITESVKGAWDGVKNWIIDKFQAVGDGVKSIFHAVVTAFKAAWDNAFSAIKSAISWVLDKIRWVTDKIAGIRDSISSIGEKAKGWVSSKVEGVKGALGFARGGLFQPNSPQLVMVGDNKTEPEVIAPRSMIVDAMRQVMAETGGGRSQTADITLNIDGRTLARLTYDDLVQEGIRNGRGTIA